MLMLMMLAPLSAAYRIPRATMSSVPWFGEPKMSSHMLSITLTGMIFTLKATPAMPALLLVSCPMVPLTCVPWPSRSSGAVSFQMKSRGATNRLAGPSSGASTKLSVRSPSGGYRTPLSFRKALA